MALRTFAAGENVLVYNTLTKKNDIGTVINIVGKNCYNINIDGRVRLVSADVMSKCNVNIDQEEDSESDSSSGNVHEIVEPEECFENESGPENVCEMDNSFSDGSSSIVEGAYPRSENDVHPDNDVYIIPQRRQHRTEADRLHDLLSPGPVASRTRSGR